jgi:hypothetical protein
MSPFVIYLLLFLMALTICLLGALKAPSTTRSCPGCGRDLDIQARRCRDCGFRPR